MVPFPEVVSYGRQDMYQEMRLVNPQHKGRDAKLDAASTPGAALCYQSMHSY